MLFVHARHCVNLSVLVHATRVLCISIWLSVSYTLFAPLARVLGCVKGLWLRATHLRRDISHSLYHWITRNVLGYICLLSVSPYSLSFVLVAVMKSKELKTNIYSHAHSLIRSLVRAQSMALVAC